jgi:hypothetical protein
VNTTSTQTTLVVVLVVLALALLAIGGVGFAFHQKKKAIAESSWIVSGNPDYLDTVRIRIFDQKLFRIWFLLCQFGDGTVR